MDELQHRISRLERTRDVLRHVHGYAALVDQGPYNADDLVEDWAADGCFDTGTEVFRGRDEIHRFFADLAAAYTIHFSTNPIVELDPALDSAEIRTYGFEAPVISGQALVGAFGHRARCRWTGEGWEWTDRQQTMYFLSPVSRGWDDDNRITEQRNSRGAQEISTSEPPQN